MDPGPVERDLLTLQAQHRSEAIWATGGHGPMDSAVLTFRRCEAALRRHAVISPAVMALIRQSGFQGLHEVPFRSLDCGLMTALVERWRPETHTFHLRCGEATVTLQDVELILGLPVDGRAVTGRTDYDWDAVCEDLLGIRPPPAARKGGRIKMRWLRGHFEGVVAEDAAPVVVAQQARGYLLQLLGGTIFADHSSSFVHLCYLPLLEDLVTAGTYSWGSAALAVLYNQLCHGAITGSKDVGGSFILLQIWAWDRLPHLSPRRRGRVPLPANRPLLCRWRDNFVARDLAMHVVSAHRYTLNIGQDTEFIWVPYNADLIARLPDFCRAGSAVWTACVPLVHFATVEMHQPDRVQRQFGYKQVVPGPSRSLFPPHGRDMRASTKDWIGARAKDIAEWDQRIQHVLPVGVADNGVYPMDDPYRAWYNSRTRRFISRMGACTGRMQECFERLRGPPQTFDANAIGTEGVELMSIFYSLIREPPSPPSEAAQGDDVDDEAPPVSPVLDDSAPTVEVVATDAPTAPVHADPLVDSTPADARPSSSVVHEYLALSSFDHGLSPVVSDLDWGLLSRFGSSDAGTGEGSVGRGFSVEDVAVDPVEASDTPGVEQSPKRYRTHTSDGEDDGSGSSDDTVGPCGSTGVITQVEQEAGRSLATPMVPTRPQRRRRAPRCGTGGHRIHHNGARGQD